MALQHAADICAAVDVPVNGDFENGFGDNPETVAETVRLAAEAGLAGVSIEDTAVPATETPIPSISLWPGSRRQSPQPVRRGSC